MKQADTKKYGISQLNSIPGRIFYNHCLLLYTVSFTYPNEVISRNFLKQKLLRDKKWQTLKSKLQWLSPNLLIFRETPMFLKHLGSGFVSRPVHYITFTLDQEQSHPLTTS